MTANDRQEGGTHYWTEPGTPQHWDLAITFGWDPFQYQITKYVMRWKDKFPTPEKRLEDLKKAQHFLEKYIENWAMYDTANKIQPKDFYVTELPVVDMSARETKSAILADGVLTTYMEPKLVDSFWSCEGYLGDGRNVFQCRLCKHEERVFSLEKAYDNHPDCSRAHAHFAAP